MHFRPMFHPYSHATLMHTLIVGHKWGLLSQFQHKYSLDTFAKSKFPVTEKLMNETLLPPPQVALKILK